MEIRAGRVTHYYDRIMVAVLDLDQELAVGDSIHIRGRDTDFTQQVKSLEIEHRKIQSAGPGEEVALKVSEPVRKGDVVLKVITEE